MTKSSTRKHVLTEVEVCTWLGCAIAGDALGYHRGFLVKDCHPSTSQLSPPERLELARVARRVRMASEMGLAVLMQRRHGPNDYSYLIVALRRRSSPHTPALSRRVIRNAETV